jgi:hypothetical protein
LALERLSLRLLLLSPLSLPPLKVGPFGWSPSQACRGSVVQPPLTFEVVLLVWREEEEKTIPAQRNFPTSTNHTSILNPCLDGRRAIVSVLGVNRMVTGRD